MTAHHIIIHFPISLAVTAAVLDLIGVGLDERGLREWAWRFLLAAAVGVFLAFGTGEGASLQALSSGVSPERLASHQELASVGVWAVIGAALLRSLWRNRTSGAYGWINLLILLLATGLLVVITVTGTLVRHGG